MEEDTPWPSATDVHPSLAGATNYEPAHEEYWQQLTLKEAVSRGEKLRAQKVTLPRRDKQYKVIGLEYIKRPPLRKRCSQTCRHVSSNYKHIRPKTTPKSLGTCDLTTCKRYKKLLRCSMRIEELAIPSKRQCLDTWRENYRILPEVMVNRLREHVLDQRPIVRVDDAIRCFRSKRKKKSSSNQLPVSSKRQIKSVKDMDELKCLCGKFAGKICKQLSVPLKIRLNPQQQRVAQIVARDIKDMMRSRKERCQYNNLGYKKILSEVSTMVSVWIATILDESSDRLLDEALRELEEEEGPALDILESIMDVIGKMDDPSVSLSETSSDSYHKDQGDGIKPVELDYENMVNETGNLKEQEGPKEVEKPPVVDEGQEVETGNETDYMITEDTTSLQVAIDEDGTKLEETPKEDVEKGIPSSYSELVNEVKKGIDEDNEVSEKPSSTKILAEDRHEQNDNIEERVESPSTELTDEDKQNQYENIEELQKPNAELLDKDKRETYEDIEETDQYPSTNLLDQDKPVDIEESDKPEFSDKYSLKKSEDNKAEKSSTPKIIHQEVKDELEDVTSLDTEIVNKGQPEKLKASEGFHGTDFIDNGKLQTDISPLENEEFVDADDTINTEVEDEKKVTFDALGADLRTESETKHKISAENLNSPNDHILSEVDESWPKDLVLPVDPNPLKVVKKSVTSLGNIQEASEKIQSPKVESEKQQSNETIEEYVDALTLEQSRQDSVSSQTQSVTKNKAQVTEFDVKVPAPIIPFNKSTETGEEKFTEIKGDSLKEVNVEIENKSEQTTEEVTDQKQLINKKLEPVRDQLKENINEETTYATARMKLDETDAITQESEEQETVVKQQLQNKTISLETVQQHTTVNDELYNSGEKVDMHVNPVFELSDKLVKVKSGEIQDTKTRLSEIKETKALTNASDETEGIELVNKLEFESVTESEQSNIESSGELPQVKSNIIDGKNWVDTKPVNTLETESITKVNVIQNSVTAVSDDLAKKEVDETFETPLPAQEIEKQKQQVTDEPKKHEKNKVIKENPRRVSEVLAKTKQKRKLDHEQKPAEMKAPKLVANMTKHLADTKFKDEQETQKTKPHKPTMEDKNVPKVTKEFKTNGKESKLPSKAKPKATKKPIYSMPLRAKPEAKPIVDEQLKSKLIAPKPIHMENIEEASTVQPRFDYKVCLETAPSWVLNQGKGEPSEDSLLTQIKERHRLKERKLRKWCHDLEVTAINLEKWSNWIDDATANIMYLKRNKCHAHGAEFEDQHKNWKDLKTCIDKDTLLWSKMYHRAVRKLDRHKSMLKPKVEPINNKDECPCKI